MHPPRAMALPRAASNLAAARAARTNGNRWAAVLIGFVLGGLATAGAAYANGGRVQVERQTAGPYALTVFTDPTPIPVGIVDVSVAVQPVGSSFFVPNAQV